MRQSARFPAEPESVPSARRFAATAIPGLPREVVDTIAVIVSELVTNCVRHGASVFELRIVDEPGRILVEVEDDSDGRPIPRTAGPLDTSGRGLQIVRQLADNWGVSSTPGRQGKTVWAVIATPLESQLTPRAQSINLR
jgi:anti-sigma regulatory factor (Ser/Thr protein kinase)